MQFTAVTDLNQHPNKGQTYDLSNGLEHSVDVHWQTHIRSSDGLPSSAYIPPDVIGKDAMLSVASTAKPTGKKIGIHGSGCGTTPFWGGTVDVPLVNNLWMF